MCLLLGRAGQLGSTVFAFALLGCAYKFTLDFVLAVGCMFLFLVIFWLGEPGLRSPERGPLIPLLVNFLQPLAVGGLLYWFFAGDHVDNNYAQRNQTDIWRYTYTNSSTEETKTMRISRDQMMEYGALHLDNTEADLTGLLTQQYRYEEFAFWPEVTTGGTISQDYECGDFCDNEDYRSLVLEPLPANATWSTPFSYECRDRTCGLYPTYLFLAMSVLGMTAAILLDPRCGIGEEAKAWSEALQRKLMARRRELEASGKLNAEFVWTLCLHADD